MFAFLKRMLRHLPFSSLLPAFLVSTRGADAPGEKSSVSTMAEPQPPSGGISGAPRHLQAPTSLDRDTAGFIPTQFDVRSRSSVLHDFLVVLFRDAPQDTEIGISACHWNPTTGTHDLVQPLTFDLTEISAATDSCMKLDEEGFNVFVSPSSRSAHLRGETRSSDFLSSMCIILRAPYDPSGLDALLARFTDRDIQPWMILDTGDGWHIQFHLDEAVRINQPWLLRRFRLLSSAISQDLGGDPIGLTDFLNTLKQGVFLPGAHNHRAAVDGEAPVIQVKVLADAPRYTLEQLESAFGTAPIHRGPSD